MQAEMDTEPLLDSLTNTLQAILKGGLAKLTPTATRDMAELMTQHGARFRWVIDGGAVVCELVLPEAEDTPQKIVTVFLLTRRPEQPAALAN